MTTLHDYVDSDGTAQAVEVYQPPRQLQSLAAYRDRLLTLEGEMKSRIMEMGRLLDEVSDALSYERDQRGFTAWVEEELGWSRRTAYNYIRVWRRFGKHEIAAPKMQALPIPQTGWYEMAKEDTPPEVADDLIQRADRGEQMSLKFIKRVIRDFRANAEPGREPDGQPAPPPAPPRLPNTLCLFCRAENVPVYPLNADNARQGICRDCAENAAEFFEE